ncbi:ribosome quality control complex subunit NEMF homolog isoform X2 [Phymastichus coffea]|uniref:ribosome quality control complex subunit NEMF homolog isoform X2 n=1 Tax=Phymastichus coffea TaxID=108790 RepID=UPI00273AC2B6|nr:ribosome quality control complex subunit NEMF homolog isoform X2 [Phymastichus coffea]
MKNRFNTYDIVCSVTELQKLIGMRVNQIYDIDNKTYLIRFQRSEEKCVLLLESANRIHTTAFEWPKNVAPSGFSMKMRKHLKNKRLESLKQLGVDRIIDLQFGSGEAAYHIFLELYDRGNIVLTDHEWTILNLLRPHTEGDKIRLAVKEKYSTFRARNKVIPTFEELQNIIKEAKHGESLKKILNPHLELGAAVIDHVLLEVGFTLGCKIGKDFDIAKDADRLFTALKNAHKMMDNAKKEVSKGYIVQKKELKAVKDNEDEFLYTNLEFHPFLFAQNKDKPFKEYETFDRAVDEYFSQMESQKIDLKFLQQEREALKKLENVKKDHDQRLVSLGKTQEVDKQKAELITRNQELVDNAIFAVQSAVANQMSWQDIQLLVKEAQARSDPVASAIKQLKLETNHISLLLEDPYTDSDEEEPELKSQIVDIDLAHSAFANARKYYDQKRSAAKKQQKTLESQGKALKSAERKTKQTLKEVQAIHIISKARKVYWFEKFYWFITSENYLVISGRDQQQNELIVKRYLKTGDIYVHADLTGASSVVIKNPDGNPVPPKSLAEAGTMAVAYSIAWEAKVVAGAWWVRSDQVSKTAPTGEYLTTGSFMIRGKKNYLPPCQLIMGLGFLFRLEDSSIERHKNERRVRTLEEGEEVDHVELYNEIELEDDDEKQSEKNLDTINEDESESLKEVSLKNSDNSNEGEDQSLFPDTQIKLDLTGPRVKIQVDDTKTITKLRNDLDNVVYLGDDKPVTLKNAQNKSVPRHSSRKVSIRSDDSNETEIQAKQNQSGLKRGQRGKLKKIKEKYKDQDEEDRKILMAVLQSAGSAKEDKRKSKNKDPSGPRQQGKKKGPPPKVNQPQQNNPGADADDEDQGPGPEVDMLDQLTGKPVAEDELLFAVPVVAPYSTLQSYKFKVKLTPGTGKRGKAAKTAVTVFLKDKTITSREKELLKAVKDETIARNIPGKVKISAPQIQKLKK